MEDRVVNCGMIVLARESRGWTQSQLADAIGVSQSKISKYELGAMPVSDEDAHAIADALEYECTLLCQRDAIHAVGASLLYRQKASVPVSMQKRVEAEINIRKMQISRLLRSSEIRSDHNFPSIPADTFDGNAAQVAREVRRVLRVPKGPIKDLTSVVEAAGGIVVPMEFGSRLIDGAHLWVAGLPPMFFMNDRVSGERYRFSLAHECGHAVMHRASGIGEIEDEANAFASEFLMPERDIKSDLRNLDLERARLLKTYWKVSMQSLIERAYQLKQISYDKRRRMWTQLSSQGMRIEEPWPIPMETAEILNDLIGFHRTQIGLSDEVVRATVLFTDQLGPIDPSRRRRPAQPLRLVGQGSLFPRKDDPDSGPTISLRLPSSQSPDALRG